MRPCLDDPRSSGQWNRPARGGDGRSRTNQASRKKDRRGTPPRVPRCHLLARLPHAAGAAGRHDPLGPVHRRAGEPGHARTCSSKYRTAADYAAARPAELEARHPEHRLLPQQGQEHPAAAARRWSSSTAARCPQDLDALVELPGVGRKTANVVLGTAFGIASGVVVDTHVARLSRRLGLTPQKDPVKIERDLMALLPAKEWIDFQPPHDPARPADLHGPQAEVRRVPAGVLLSADRASAHGIEAFRGRAQRRTSPVY